MHFALNLEVAQLKRIITDIALTINIHPVNLCIEVWVAKYLFELEKKIRSQLSSSNFQDFTRNMKKLCGKFKQLFSDNYISSRILRVHISYDNFSMTVIVLEHRNLETALKWFENKIKRVLIVMICIRFCLFNSVAF